jgi:hypothetical protein
MSASKVVKRYTVIILSKKFESETPPFTIMPRFHRHTGVLDRLLTYWG